MEALLGRAERRDGPGVRKRAFDGDGCASRETGEVGYGSRRRLARGACARAGECAGVAPRRHVSTIATRSRMDYLLGTPRRFEIVSADQVHRSVER
eukprot:22493-Pelagococcus_subviridis.AAC.4